MHYGCLGNPLNMAVACPFNRESVLFGLVAMPTECDFGMQFLPGGPQNVPPAPVEVCTPLETGDKNHLLWLFEHIHLLFLILLRLQTKYSHASFYKK